MSVRRADFAFAALIALAGVARAQDLSPVRLEVTQPTVWGESVYALGDHPALGQGDPTRAARMRPVGAHRWALDVAVEPGTVLRWVALVRDNTPGALADPRNARVVSGVQQVTAGAPAERTVRVRYLSGFAAPRLAYERAPGRWDDAPMRRVGDGRGPGEWLWEVTVATSLPALTFFPHDGQGAKDLSPEGGPYRTTRGDLVLASGEVLPDLPPARRTPSRVVTVRGWTSHVLGDARDLFVYLSRDYDVSPARRYPVLYMHDGQNLFDPRAMMGGWRAQEALDREIATGRVEDLIVVGVANTPARMQEYVPPESGGRADAYGRFLVDELKPWVDRTLRTRPGREDTGVMGSSLGGLVSFYLAWERPDVFGRAGSLSGSFWLRGHLEAIEQDAPRDLRVYLDSGTAGASGDSYEDTVAARDLLLGKGWVLGRDLRHVVDLGAAHSEPYWAARLGGALGFLFPAR